MSKFTKDVKKIVPSMNSFTIGGKTIVFDKIPTRISLEAIEIQERLDKNEASVSELLKFILRAFEKIGSKADPEITYDWLLDNTTVKELSELNSGVLIGGSDDSGDADASKGEPAKN